MHCGSRIFKLLGAKPGASSSPITRGTSSCAHCSRPTRGSHRFRSTSTCLRMPPTEQRTRQPVEHAGACIELHDVAPATWPECALILAMLDQIGNIPVTLLVVPNFHGRGSIVDDRRF